MKSLPPPHDVELYWSYEAYAPSHQWDRVLATSSVDLVFPLEGQALRWRDARGVERVMTGPIVCGPRTSFYDVPVDTQRRMAGVRLRAGGAWALLGVAVDELAERFVPLDVFIGAEAHAFDERLREVGADQPRQLKVLQALIASMQRSSRVVRHGAVSLAVRALAGPQPVNALASDLGLSHRRFIELFRREIGLTPRDFRRVHRFHHVMARTALEPLAALGAANDGADALPAEVRGQMLPILAR